MKSSTPKVLHPVCGRPMVGLVVDAARDAGFTPIVVVVPSDYQAIRDALGDGVTYAEQSEPLGSGHALLQAEPFLAGVESVAVLSGDVPLIRPDTLKRIMRLQTEGDLRIIMLTSTLDRPDGFGRVTRDDSGRVTAVVEESEADERTLAISEVNAGIYGFQTEWLWEALKGIAPSSVREIFLTGLASVATQHGLHVETVQTSDPHEVVGVNTRVQLAGVEAELRRRIREEWMLRGVSMPDPATAYIDAGVELGADTVILPNTHIKGSSRIGSLCEMGPNTLIIDSSIGDRCRVVASVVEESRLADDVGVGPFSHIRWGSLLETGVHIGNFAEVKNSRLGPGTVSAHFSYVGDADLGSKVNIGAGTVTCNYDGVNKHHTSIGDDAFIGSDSMLVAPVTIGARSSTGAGSVVTDDVPPDSLAVGVPAKVRPKRKRKR